MVRWPACLLGLAVCLGIGCGDGTGRPDEELPDDDDTTGDDDTSPDDDDAADDDDVVLGTPSATVEVLIVGAGAAGMAAAMDCVEAGVDVLVAEQNGTVSDFGSKMALFSGSAEQEAAGFEDSPEVLLDEWASFTGGDPDDPWVIQFAQRNVPDVRDWLFELGFEYHLGTENNVDAGSLPRLHVFDFEGEIGDPSPISVALEGAGVIRHYLYVTGLVQRDGAVEGVTYQDLSDGTTGWIRARSTVVTTGGFLRNLEMVHEARPELADVELWFGTMFTADGNGHRMLTDLGATLQNARAFGLYANGYPHPTSSEATLVDLTVSSGIWVNVDGARFTNEAVLNSFGPAEDVVVQPDGIAWLVLDQAGVDELDPLDVMAMMPYELEMEELIDAGWAAAGDTPAELAVAAGLDPSGLEQTLLDWASYVAMESEDPWQGLDDPAPRPIDQPPYYAIRLAPTLAKAFGGVDVDLDGRVLDGAGQVIPGVLAAGELTGMAGGTLVGDRGFTGSISAVLLSGRIAGQTAAADALEQRAAAASGNQGGLH